MAHADPNDIVPRGDIAYDQLGSLASSGLLPGYTVRDFARGDFLYTREEIARIIRSSEQASGQALGLPKSSSAALRALRLQYAPELERIGAKPDSVERGIPANSGLLTGQIKVRGLTGPAVGDAIGRASFTLPVGRDGFAALSLGNSREEWYPNGDNRSLYPLVETALVRMNGRALDVTVGVSPLRWGPGYAGSLLMSDDAPSVPRIQVEKGFRLPGTLGAHLGRLYYTEFIGQFFEPDISTAAPDAQGTRRYLGGRRIEASGGRWTFSVSEAFKSTRLPGPEWAAALPTFYEYQNDWSKSSRSRPLQFLAAGALPDSAWFNYIADSGVTYKPGGRSGLQLYSDLLADDFKTLNGLGTGYDTPRKIGFQFGANMPHLDSGGRYGLRLEYAQIDPRTYTDASLPIQWSDKGVPIGYPAGSRTRVLFGRLDATVSSKVKLAIEGEDRANNGDGIFLAPVEPLRRRVSLYGTYALRRDLFLGARAELRRYTDGSEDVSRNRGEVNVGYGF